MENFCNRQILHSYSSLIFNALMLMRTGSSTMLSPFIFSGHWKTISGYFLLKEFTKLFMFEAVQRTDSTGKPYGKANNQKKIQKAVKPLFYEPETTQPSPYLWEDSTGDLLKDSCSSYSPDYTKGFCIHSRL